MQLPLLPKIWLTLKCSLGLIPGWSCVPVCPSEQTGKVVFAYYERM